MSAKREDIEFSALPTTSDKARRASSIEREREEDLQAARRRERKFGRWSCSMASTKTKCLLVVIGIVVAIAVILIAVSFKGLHYYEYGFRRRQTTGKVDLSHVYAGGKHCIGPDYNFKVFPASAHFLEFEDITVFADDRLEVHISANMQYFLRKHQLDELHKQYDLNYETVIMKNAKDAIKSAATAFTTRQFISQRLMIEQALFDAVRLRVGGRCCELNCGTAEGQACMQGCLPYEQCTAGDWGSFADVRYFQLLDLTIPSDLSERYTQALVLQEADEREHFLQDAQIVRKETDRKVAEVENEALRIDEYAASNSTLIRAQADANATLTVENARSSGLRMLYNDLGITDAAHKASFDYLRTIKRMSGAHIAVNYDTLINGASLSNQGR